MIRYTVVKIYSLDRVTTKEHLTILDVIFEVVGLDGEEILSCTITPEIDIEEPVLPQVTTADTDARDLMATHG